MNKHLKMNDLQRLIAEFQRINNEVNRKQSFWKHLAWRFSSFFTRPLHWLHQRNNRQRFKNMKGQDD